MNTLPGFINLGRLTKRQFRAWVSDVLFSESRQQVTEDNLRKWITDNEALVPGTRMRHVAIADPAERDYLISFLHTLR